MPNSLSSPKTNSHAEQSSAVAVGRSPEPPATATRSPHGPSQKGCRDWIDDSAELATQVGTSLSHARESLLRLSQHAFSVNASPGASSIRHAMD